MSIAGVFIRVFFLQLEALPICIHPFLPCRLPCPLFSGLLQSQALLKVLIFLLEIVVSHCVFF